MTLRHLIVIVPGIGGSVLADADGVVWGDRMRRVVGLVGHPDRLHGNKPLRAVGLMKTLGFIAPLKAHGYDDLVRGLLNGLDTPDLAVDVAADGAGRNPRADIVLLPYDFRLGVEPAARRLAAEVTARLEHLPQRERVGRVIVIGHSMGGLVARYWALDPDQARTCAAILTVGTPHRGASKALDWLVNGAGLGVGPRVGGRAAITVTRVVLQGTTDMLRSWPGMYDLLPTYQVIDDPVGGRHLTAYDLADAGGPGFAADPFYKTQALRARDLHDTITTAWATPPQAPGASPATIPFLARDHGTVHAARLDHGRLEVAVADPGWQPNPGWRGDGTVPALSAVPPELAPTAFSHRWHHVQERHVPMAGTNAVVEMVRSLVGDDVSAVRGGPAEGLRLGIDLDDAAVLGEPVPVTVRLLDGAAPADPTGVKVFVTVQPEDRSAAQVRVEADTQAQEWQATFTPPGPGLWRVRVQAVNPTGSEPPMVSDTVAVLDPERPGTDGPGAADPDVEDCGRHHLIGGDHR